MQKKSLSGSDRERVVKTITDILAAKASISFAYIFGSFASENSFNDIDVAIFVSVEKTTSPLSLELAMECELEDAVHMPVDVRVINNAPVSFIYNVLKSGFVILDRDRSLRSDFEVAAYKKYFDLQYLRREYLRDVADAPI
ncbi:MAG TPA: nucleotidyltransferase domain-containing protein [Candidatus Binatia bacterium]|nr:nucleotidyltransferase domain-containing protein [Candidatus Binatia bacterium]